MSVMPEGVTILTITLGILGALNTARNCAQTIHDDVKGWQKARRAIENLELSLEAQNQAMVDWKEEWMVWEDDKRLCQYLWGGNYDKVRVTLKQISDRSEEIEVSLSSLSSKGKLSKKVRFVFWKKKYLKECMDELEKIVSRLLNTTRSYFRAEHRREDEPNRRDIQQVGNLHQLVRLCIDTRKLSQAFHEACFLDRYEWVVDLELDFFGPDVADDRLKAISKSAANSNLRYKVFAKEKPGSDVVIKTIIHMDPTLSEEDCQRTFTKALIEVNSQRKNSAFDTPEDGLKYRVEEFKDAAPAQSVCYRERILSEAPETLKQGPAKTVSPQRIKLALDVVEAGLLFLQTSWFSGVCSCSVRHRHDLVGQFIVLNCLLTQYLTATGLKFEKLLVDSVSRPDIMTNLHCR